MPFLTFVLVIFAFQLSEISVYSMNACARARGEFPKEKTLSFYHPSVFLILATIMIILTQHNQMVHKLHV